MWLWAEAIAYWRLCTGVARTRVESRANVTGTSRGGNESQSKCFFTIVDPKLFLFQKWIELGSDLDPI